MPTIPIERFQSELLSRPWGTELLIADGPGYTGKVLRYRAGHAGGLQYHVQKDETFYLFSGSGRVSWDRGDGTITSREMRAGDSYHIPAGAVHQFAAVTDCVVFEASTPHREDRVRCEEQYGLPADPDGLPTTWDRKSLANAELPKRVNLNWGHHHLGTSHE